MKKQYLFLLVAIVSLAIGFLSSNSIINGAGKALFGVFFILFYLTMMAGGMQDKPSH